MSVSFPAPALSSQSQWRKCFCPLIQHSVEFNSISLLPMGSASTGPVTIIVESIFNTGVRDHPPEGNVNGGGLPCRKRSRCSACSCRTCAAGEGTRQTGEGLSSMSTEKGSTAESAHGLRLRSTVKLARGPMPGLTPLERG